MKRLSLLTTLLALTCSYVTAKSTPRTASDYMAVISENYQKIYDCYWFSNANTQTVVDKKGNVLSMTFIDSDENKEALLRPEGDTMVLTIKQTGEDGSENGNSRYVFDDLLRLTHCEVHIINIPWEQSGLCYTLDMTYEKNNTESKTMRYCFPKGINTSNNIISLTLFPDYTFSELTAGDGILIEYNPELGYKHYSRATFFGSDEKPKATPAGFSSIRISYQPWPEDFSYWYATQTIEELKTVTLNDIAYDSDGNDFYVSRIEFLDEKGKLVNTSGGAAKTTIDISTTDDGQLTMVQTYLDRENRPVNQQQDGGAFARIEYIQNDSVRTAALYDANGFLAQNASGVARYYVKETEDEEIIYWMDKDGNYTPIENEEGASCYGLYSKRHFNNDEGQRVCHVSYRGTSESDRVNCTEGYSDHITYSNPEYQSQTYCESYLGTDGKPVVNAEFGYATMRYTYNDEDTLTGIAYYGADNHLIEVNGIAREVYGYRSSYYTYSPDFTWYYNAKDEMITPENMPKETCEDATEECPMEIVIK